MAMTHSEKSRGARSGAPIVLRPVTGLPRFRKNVSLRFDGNAIVVTDRRGRSRTFALDGTEGAPTDIRAFGLDQGLMDGAGNLLAVWENGIWNTEEEMALVKAGGFYWGMQPGLPPMRSDGIRMYDLPTIPMMRTFSGIGAVGFAGLQLHFLPSSLADLLLTGGFIGGAISVVLYKIGSRVDPDVAESRRQAAREALAEAARDDDDDNDE